MVHRLARLFPRKSQGLREKSPPAPRRFNGVARPSTFRYIARYAPVTASEFSQKNNLVLKQTKYFSDVNFVMTRALKRMVVLALVLVAGTASSSAQAQQGTATKVPMAKPVSSAPPTFGVMLDAGLPDGATASLAIRPTSWLRAELGGGYNMISKSVRGGLSLIPFGAGPSATLEAGRFFEGNANGFARQIAGASFEDNAVLERVGYDFANAHLGLDFGSRYVTFFIHGGMSYIRANVHNLNGAINSDSNGSSSTTVSINQDPVVKILTPSVKLGFVFYIW